MIFHPSLKYALEVVEELEKREEANKLAKADLVVETFRWGRQNGLSIGNAMTSKRAILYLDPDEDLVVLIFGSERRFVNPNLPDHTYVRKARYPSDQQTLVVDHLVSVLT